MRPLAFFSGCGRAWLIRRRRKPEIAGSSPAIQTVSVHWCSGTAQCLVTAEARDRHPYAPLLDRARGRAAQAAACKAAEAGSTPAGHSDVTARSASGEAAGLSRRPEGIETPTGY